MNKLILALMTITFIVSSCTVTEKAASNTNEIWWISGIKTECSGVAEKMNWLNIHKGENTNDPNWENLYSSIEGFEFEEGFLKKIEVKVSKFMAAMLSSENEFKPKTLAFQSAKKPIPRKKRSSNRLFAKSLNRLLTKTIAKYNAIIYLAPQISRNSSVTKRPINGITKAAPMA